jgi:hypothetical protein
MRARWNRWRFGLRSRARLVFVQIPASTITAGGLADVRYRTHVELVPGEVL